MESTIKEILQFVEENDVKFIRLAFCDLTGVEKNISIMPQQLRMAFTQGISFDASAIKGFRDVKQSDLFLVPDPSSLSVMPWRPGPGRVVKFFCDIKLPDGTNYSHDGRHMLKKIIHKYEQEGLHFKVGAECEFYLFKVNDEGEVSKRTIDQGGYMDVFPRDKGENIRREICLTLEEMGIEPEASHHEQGPGQNEVDFKFSDPLTCADNILVFRSVVKTSAARNGMYASFMAKPIETAPGNGMHVNVSITKNGKNVFQEGCHDAFRQSFIAGVLKRVKEISVFLNPTVNSYDRLGSFEAPKYISWSKENRSQLIRVPAANEERSRMELRSSDNMVNPYVAFSLIIAAGMEGVTQKLVLEDAVNEDLYNTSIPHLQQLPSSLKEAIAYAKDSVFLKEVIGQELLQRYLEVKEKEVSAFEKCDDKEMFYDAQYFHLI